MLQKLFSEWTISIEINDDWYAVECFDWSDSYSKEWFQSEHEVDFKTD